MQTARCYTKSGSVEKYESNLWKSPISENWSTGGDVGTITTPDSNGNYTVTPGGDFEDSDTHAPTSYYCFTKYNNVITYFYFKKSTPKPPAENGKITLFLHTIETMDQKIVFACDVSASPSFTGAKFIITLAFEYYEHDISGNLKGPYTKNVSSTVTSSSDSFSDEVNLYNYGGGLHSYSLISLSPNTTKINNIVYEIRVQRKKLDN
jgi:hypothetical protein